MSYLPEKIERLLKCRATAAQLEKEIAADLNLTSTTVSYLVERAPASARPAPIAIETPKVRKRTKVTDAMRALVKKLVTEGKSGSKIAKQVGISMPTVHNIKKALGLVKARPKGKK